MIPLKNSEEIKIMKEGGKIAAEVLAKVLAKAEVGIATLELDTLAEKFILEAGAKPSFKGFDGYPFTTCINVNEGIVHGLPKADLMLKKGDLTTVDLGVFYRGLHTDNALTIEVGSSKLDKFLDVGQKALEKAIKQCQVGNHVGDISHTIQTIIEGAGYNVARELGGHGVGKKLHEAPFIPGFGQLGEGASFEEGMTLAIEVIYAAGNGKMAVLNDGWTVVTVSGKVAGLFEDTVALTKSGPVVLTKT